MILLLRLITLAGVLTTATANYSLRRLEYQAAMIPMAPSCFVENGYDYVGNDITHKQGTVGECCNLCDGTPGCKAWSWSNYNSGTCWLKWARGEVIVNPTVKSAVLSVTAPQYCQLQVDVDYVDNDIARVDSPTADGCCDLCQNYLGCRAYTWSDYGGGSCWLKSKVTQTVPKPGVKSAKAYPDQQYNCPYLEYSLDYVDHDIANKPANQPEECCDICRTTVGCRAFSFSRHNGGTCWLKSQKGVAIYNPGVISAQIAPNPPPCVLQNDIDYYDNDFANVQNIADPTQCCDICRGKSGCKAFSWSDYNGGTCWLKTANGAPVVKPGVKSGSI